MWSLKSYSNYIHFNYIYLIGKNKNFFTSLMNNLSHFRDQYRIRGGKPPMIKRNTPRQSAFIKRSSLIHYFQEKVNKSHSKSYFTHPYDISDLEKENSKLNGMIKIFFLRCDEDTEKAKQVIDFFSGDYGEWCNWKPSQCFRKETVQDFENGYGVNKNKQNKSLVSMSNLYD